MKKILFITYIMLSSVVLGFTQSTTVYTCKGSSVNADILSAGTTDQKNAWRQQFLNWGASRGLGESDILDEASGAYNCHAYAWHLREGNTNQVWITNATYSPSGCQPETHNIDTYWTDGCFIKVCSEADADKTHYYCGDHSAVTSTVVAGKFESKWGKWPVIRHNPTTVPYEQPTTVNYYASTKISGDASNLCTGNRTFTVKNISGAAYTWTYSNSVSAVGATNTNQLIVQRNGSSNGPAWAEVQISMPCSGTSATNRINFTVGIPQASNIILWNSTSSTTMGNPVNFVAGYPPANRCQILATDWQVFTMDATVSLGNFPCEPDNGTSANIFFHSTGTAYVQARVQNSCGWSDWSAAVPIQVNGGYFYMISPNPASSNITVQQKEKTNADISEVRLFDNLGNLKKQLNYGTGTKQVQINTTDLKTGLYFIEISSGQAKERQQLIIQK